MKTEPMTTITAGELTDSELDAAAGGNKLGEILISAAGSALFWAVEKTIGAVYDWSTKADHPPYVRE